ncbi:MAG: hypothetical protein KAS04_03670, partial [Candidatus Aenigmarchaeota archaeon]|nr:hypothetical protein [Candidatus Aenigmarchaeota archaeon]
IKGRLKNGYTKEAPKGSDGNLNAKDTIALVKEVTDMDELKVLFSKEADGDNRKSVIEAMEKKLEELKED